MTANDFYSQLDFFLSKMKRVQKAVDLSDGMGYRSRSRNIFAIPAKYKDDFLKFLDESGIPKDFNIESLGEDEHRPFSCTSVRFSEGEYHDAGTWRNYDGFLECDRAALNLKCVGWTMCSFATLSKEYKRIHKWRGIKDWYEDKWVSVNDPIIRGELTRWYYYGDGYYPSGWRCDGNIICFIG